MSPNSTFRLIQLGIVALIALAIAAVIYLVVLAPKPNTELVKTQALFAEYQGTAQIYRSRMLDFDGVCEGLYLAPTVTCEETEAAYAISMPMSDGGYYCADSSGYADRQLIRRKTPTSCQ